MSRDELIPPELLSTMLVRMFEFAPVAMAITTSDTESSSYVKVNQAYLDLTGLSWEQISGKRLTSHGAAIDNPARDRRHRLLAEEGGYELEDVELRHADGTIIPTLISAQRTIIDGVSFDVEIIIDVSARLRHQREIEHALKASARTDHMSGLPNRAAFDEWLEEKVRASDGERQLTLAFVDLNGFKAVNDGLGHHAGDEALRVVANRLRECFRSSDFIARIGGDEFVLLMEVDRLALPGFQDMLEGAIRRVFKPIPIDGQVAEIGAAVGVAFLRPDDTPASFLKRADGYMYLAKRSGERIAIVCIGGVGEIEAEPQPLALTAS